MSNPFYFLIEEKLKIGFKIDLESRKNNIANSILKIIPTYADFGIETRYINKILKKWLLSTVVY